MKILEIDSCFNCKHIWRDATQHCDYCELVKAKPFDADIDGIPNWCPLPERDPKNRYNTLTHRLVNPFYSTG